MLLLALLACSPCDATQAHYVGSGEYRATADPECSDATSAIVFLHGHGANQYTLQDSPGLTAMFESTGWLGVYPNGTDGAWKVGHHVEDITRSDRAFVAEVAADVRATWGVDHVVLAGHSEGAAMVYDALCVGEGGYDGYVPMSGAFWEPRPETCTAPPQPVLHLHGETDTNWPLDGSEPSDIGTKGSVLDALALARDARGCPDADEVVDGDCTSWPDCEPMVRLCMHPGGHVTPEDWVQTVAEAMP